MAGRIRSSLLVLVAAAAAFAVGVPAASAASAPVPPSGRDIGPSIQPGPAPAPIPGPRSLGFLVVTVAFQGGDSTPASTPDQTTSSIAGILHDQINPWFFEVSHGQFGGYSTTQRGPVTIQPKAALCSEAWRAEVNDLVDAEVRKLGVEPTQYNAVISYFHQYTAGQSADCADFGGNGQLPSQGNHVLLNGLLTKPALLHELGHNLGLLHAPAQFCTDLFGTRVTLSGILGRCTQKEYGDEYDAMGELNSMGYSSMRLAQLGWNVGRVETITADITKVTRFLTPLEDNVAGSTQALRLVDGATTFWVEFRKAVGVDKPDDPTSPLEGGVLVRTEATDLADLPAQNTVPVLLDMTPDDHDDTVARGRPWSPEMSIGQTWKDPRGDMSITLNSEDPHGASVTIDSAAVFVTMPGVIGQTRAAATQAITAAGLVASTVTPVTDPFCENLGNVISQTPAAGTRLHSGYGVTITYGVPPKPRCPDPRM